VSEYTPDAILDYIWGEIFTTETTREAGECLEWSGGRRGKYGVIAAFGGNWGAHRLAWVLTFGPIPDGLQVLHRCDNPPCVNPYHLFLGTNGENINDRVAKGRSRQPR
jgi:hypothetical protein